MWFSGSKNKEELVLVFDIGSASIGGALFYLEHNGIPRIVFSVREPIVMLDTIETDQLLSLTLKSLSVVVETIGKQGIGAPSKIFCVLSSPWYASQTRIIKYQKNTPFIFTNKLADSLIEKEIGIFSAEHLEKYVHIGNSVVPIELKNMKMMLNGYSTPKPLDQKATELEMTIFISMSSEQFLENIQETIRTHYHTQNIKFSSFVMASFAVVRDVFAEDEDFMLIDIGGEVTDIAMIKREVLRESISFPMGPNCMIRSIAHELHCTLDEAATYMTLYKDGHANDAAHVKIDPIMQKVKAEWLKKFQESLANLSNDISIPATLYITVDQELGSFFSELIKSEQFSQYTLTASKFKVIVLDAPALHGGAAFTDVILRDPFVILESIYINRYLR